MNAPLSPYPLRCPEPLQTAADEGARPELVGRGEAALLRAPLLALFCSARMPAELVLPMHDLLARLAPEGAVISGFQSPMEREALAVLLDRRLPVVLLHARDVGAMRLPHAWRVAAEAGRMLIASAAPPRHQRPTRDLARRRNRLAASLATRTLMLYAEPGGQLHTLASELSARGRPLLTLGHPRNDALLLLGAEALR